MHIFKKNFKDSGFTLVELAIVMTIIGLLIGGILKGQEMMANARLSGTISQVQAYQSAQILFRDAYASEAGDLRNAESRLPGCAAASFCFNGNGNGVVGNYGAGYHGVDATMASENTQFWKHLAAADMITGVMPGANTVQWGMSHPAARLPGGFFVRAARNDAMCLPDGQCCIEGLLLILRSSIEGTWYGAVIDARYPVTPREAWQIDRKMDDGRASRGSVQAASAGHSYGCGYINVNAQNDEGYEMQLTRRACDMMFKIQ